MAWPFHDGRDYEKKEKTPESYGSKKTKEIR